MNKVKLSVYRNDQEVSSYEFDAIDGVEHEVFVGRSEECHLVIDDHQVSRNHISLTYSNEIMSLKNLSDYHNVYVNGKNVTNALVSDSDSIQFYDYTLTVMGVTEEKSEVSNSSPKEFRDYKKEEAVSDDINDGNKDLELPEEAPLELDDAVSDETDQLEVSISSETATRAVAPISDTELNIEIENNETSDVSSLSPEYEQRDSDIKTLTEKIQNIIERNTDENADDAMEDSEFEDETPEPTVESDVLEFTEEVDMSPGPMRENDFSEKTGVIDNFAQLYLEITGDDVPYNRYLLDKPEIVIGSSRADCSIVLEDDDVSPKHARVVYQKKRVYVEDLKSFTGTYVNGERVNKSQIKDGDEFLIGSISFVLRVGSEVLSEEFKRLMPIDAEQEVIEHQVIEDSLAVDEDGTTSQGGFSLKVKFDEYLANPEKKRIFFIVLIGLLVLVLLDDEPSTSSKVAKKGSVSTSSNKQVPQVSQEKKVERSQEEKEYLESHYQLAKNSYDEGDYDKALFEIDLVRSVDPSYKQVDMLYGLSKDGLAKIEEAERRKKEEEERLKVESKIKELLSKAEEAMKGDKLDLAETYLSQIAEFDPENKNLFTLKIEIDAAKDQQQKLKKEKAEREEKRRVFLSLLAPAKRLHTEGKWYKSMKTIEKALKYEDIDKDLLDEANNLFSDARKRLDEETQELLSEARAYKEGKDFKNAYESYKKLLAINPINTEALSEVNEIQSSLDVRAKKIFREAIVSESISLHDDAKEKFLEVLQIAPIDSEYYKKAKAKLDEFYVE